MQRALTGTPWNGSRRPHSRLLVPLMLVFALGAGSSARAQSAPPLATRGIENLLSGANLETPAGTSSAPLAPQVASLLQATTQGQLEGQAQGQGQGRAGPVTPEPGAPGTSGRGGQEASPEVAIVLRRAQGQALVYPVPPADALQVAPPAPSAPRESVPEGDRWRIMEMLGLSDKPLDPYHQNTLKGDKPLPALAALGPDWFFNLSVTSSTLFEASQIPIPVSSAGASRSGAYDVFGRPGLTGLSQTVLVSAALTEGDTTFRPPNYEIRIEPAVNFNRATAEERGVLNANPEDGLARDDHFVGLQQLFVDKHLRDVSDNYDFDSVRVGIQPFTSDFRGFVFQDDALGVRLFGTRESNLWQYNLAWLRRLDKDTNSGLNDLASGLRRDDTFIANVYRQDFPVEGHTTELTVIHNINRENSGTVYDANGFLVRPAPIGDGLAHHYQVTYYGLNGDGHFGSWNLTSSLYAALGHDSHNPIAQRAQTIEAGFAALELSRDFDWIRVRGTGLIATGDKNPYDGHATGFDAILENPLIAGADTSLFIHQAIPLIGGGGVFLSGRNALLPNLRTSEDMGQSNFVNPGLTLFGIGADFDVTPQMRVLTNLSDLGFMDTSTLEVLRNQGSIDRDIGVDASVGLQYRPELTQNVVLNASVGVLAPGKGFRQLYDTQRLNLPYSVLVNLLLRY